MSFAGFDDISCQLQDYMRQRENIMPSSEVIISGQGITNIYKFYRDYLKINLDKTLAAIDALADDQKPASIAKNADSHPVCKDIINLFVRAYGSYATDATAAQLPTAGLYLAGGIVTKNEKYFLQDNAFMAEYEKHINANILRVL